MIISEVVTAAADHAEKINAVATNQYVNQNVAAMDVTDTMDMMIVMEMGVMDGMEMGVMDGMEMGVMDGMEMGVMDGMEMGVMDGMEMVVMAGMEMDVMVGMEMAGTEMDVMVGMEMAGTEMIGIMVMMEADMAILILLGMKPPDSGEADVTDIVSDMLVPQLTNSTELWATILLEEPDKNGLIADLTLVLTEISISRVIIFSYNQY